MCCRTTGSTYDAKFALSDSLTTWSLEVVEMAMDYGMCIAQPQQIAVVKDIFLDVNLPQQAVLGMNTYICLIFYQTISVTVNSTHNNSYILEVPTKMSSNSPPQKIKNKN